MYFTNALRIYLKSYEIFLGTDYPMIYNCTITTTVAKKIPYLTRIYGPRIENTFSDIYLWLKAYLQ